MTRILLIVSLLILTVDSFVIAQTQSNDVNQPEPIIGWDSLQSSIRYPDIFIRAGVEGCYQSALEIDSIGTIKSLRTISLNYNHENNKYDSIFIARIEEALRSVTWKAANISNKPINYILRIPFIFYMSGSDRGELVLKKENFRKVYPAVY